MLLSPATGCPRDFAENQPLIERIADRATNIAESVVYLVTGTPGRMNVSRY